MGIRHPVPFEDDRALLKRARKMHENIIFTVLLFGFLIGVFLEFMLGLGMCGPFAKVYECQIGSETFYTLDDPRERTKFRTIDGRIITFDETPLYRRVRREGAP